MVKMDRKEIFTELYRKFCFINDRYDNVYAEPFKVMYNKDKDVSVNVSNTIVNYFIDHYIKETDIIIKDYKAVLTQSVWDKFWNYLYTLGMKIDKDYVPKKDEYIIKHVISEFIIENNIDLSKYIKQFNKIYNKKNKLVIHNSIDLVNYFISTYSRPWKSWYEYFNEFMDFYKTLDSNYKRPIVINMYYNEACDLVKDFYHRDIKSQNGEVQQLYFDMWNELYSYDDNGNYNGENLIYDYFINTYYKPWKYKYLYEYEWKDYIETLNID